jgi:hypothetical protein
VHPQGTKADQSAHSPRSTACTPPRDNRNLLGATGLWRGQIESPCQPLWVPSPVEDPLSVIAYPAAALSLITGCRFGGYRNTAGYQADPLARGEADPRAARSAVTNDRGARPHRTAGGSADR